MDIFTRRLSLGKHKKLYRDKYGFPVITKKFTYRHNASSIGGGPPSSNLSYSNIFYFNLAKVCTEAPILPS